MKKTVTLKDIAQKLNVSMTTISKALNNHPDVSKKLRKQIIEIADGMSYVPNTLAKTLRSKRSNFIGLIVSDNTNPYYARVIRGVEETLSLKGYHTLIFNNNEEPEKELKFIGELRSISVAGVIITPALGNDRGVRLLKKHNIPFVLAHRYIDKESDNYVIADDVKAGYIATKYLIENRYKRIFLINGDPAISSARDRCEGYRMALEENGLSYDERLVYSSATGQENGYMITKEIIAGYTPLPYSILCISDYVATGAMKALSDHKISIPGQVALMGIDDIDLFTYMPFGLTTVHIPKKELGIKSAELLLEIMADTYEAEEDENIENSGFSPDEGKKPETRQIILPPKLVVRDSA